MSATSTDGLCLIDGCECVAYQHGQCQQHVRGTRADLKSGKVKESTLIRKGIWIPSLKRGPKPKCGSKPTRKKPLAKSRK